MGDTKEFFKTIPRTLNPEAYVELARRPLNEASAYLFSTVLISFVLASLLLLPSGFSLVKGSIETSARIEKLTFSVNATTLGAIKIPEGNPKIFIDTRSRSIPEGDYLIAVNEKAFFYDFGFIKGKSEFPEKGEISFPGSAIATIIFLLTVAMLPAIVLLGVILILIKEAVIISILSIGGILASKLANLGLRRREVLNTAIYSSTLPLLLESFVFAFFHKLFFIPIMIHVIYFSIAVALNGQKNSV